MFDNERDNEYIRPSEDYIADCGIDDCNTGSEEFHSTMHEIPQSDSLSSYFNHMLTLEERLLWVGQRDRRAPMKAKGTSGLMLIFPVFWLGFSIFWTLGATAAGGVFGLFGIPFIVVGIFLFKQFLGGGGGQKYAITNMRVITVSKKGIISNNLEDLGGIAVYDCGNGFGYVSFQTANAFQLGTSRNGQYMPASALTGFYGIRNPGEVYKILNDAVCRSKRK